MHRVAYNVIKVPTHPMYSGTMPCYVWVYILASDDCRFHSVGSARDLAGAFERMRFEDRPTYPRKLVAVYRLQLLPHEYEEAGANHHRVRALEEKITLQLMKREGGNWFRVSSHYIEADERMRVPEKLRDTPFPPLCYCGVPAEERIGKNGRTYYTCPRKNRDWLERMAFPAFIKNVAHRACAFYAHGNFYETRLK